MTHPLPATSLALLTTIAALVVTPATALAGKGPKEGGVVVEGLSFGPGSARTGSESRRPANLVCFGGVLQRRSGFKLGAELLGCGGDRRGVGGLYGGSRIHWGGVLGPIRLGGGAGVGLGTLNDRSDLTGNRWTTFLYVKPGLTAGAQLGGVGIEVELFAFLPIHLAQVVQADAGLPYRIVTPGGGARVSVLFGRSPKKIREEQEALERAQKLRAEAIEAERAAYQPSPYADPADAIVGEPPPDRPLALPGPSPEPAPPVEEAPVEEPPLAIPAGPTY